MNDKITFPRLAAMLADRTGRSKRFSEDFLREFFALISEMLEAGESVKVRGLGTFRLSRVEPRMSVDVTTGQPMEIAGHSKVVFVPSKDLADAVNAPFEAFTAIEISDDVDIARLFPEDVPSLQESIDPTSAASDFDEDPDLEEEPEAAPASAESIISFLIPEEKDTPGAPHPNHEPVFNISIPSPAPLHAGDGSGQSHEPTDLSDEPDSEADEPSAYAHEIDLTEEKIPSAAPSPVSMETPAEATDAEARDTSDSPDEETAPSSPKAWEATPADEDETLTDDSETSSEDAEDSGTHADDIEDADTDEEYEPLDEHGKSRRRIFLVFLAAVVIALFGIVSVWYVFFNADFSNRFLRAADANPQQMESAEKPGTAPDNDMTATAATDTPSDSIREREAEEVPTVPSDALVYDTISTTRYLTTMAKSHYGNYNLWPYIYEENKAILGHPDRIRPGTPVVIPDLRKYGVDPSSEADIDKAKKMGMEIYARYGKKI